jgi:hypothetical protein
MRFQLFKNVTRGYSFIVRYNVKNIEKNQIKNYQEKMIKSVFQVKKSEIKSNNHDFITNDDIKFLNDKALEHTFKN